MAGESDKLPAKSSQSDIDAFLERVARMPTVKLGGGRGRLIFALDATASRKPTWDRACHLQAEMFKEAASLGGLDIQLSFYRGFGEFKAFPWLAESAELLRRMTGVHCLGGHTQIAKVLRHATNETKKKKVDALVFVGDATEEEVDNLCQLAGQLGMLGVPAFMFHEGHDPVAGRAFQQIARLTKGAYCRFDAGSAQTLRDLLSAVAVYAAGGRKALEDFGRKRGGAVLKLTHQVQGR